MSNDNSSSSDDKQETIQNGGGDGKMNRRRPSKHDGRRGTPRNGGMRGGNRPSPHPPVAHWQRLFWILFLVAIPLISYFATKDSKKTHVFSQSNLENFLMSDHVKELDIITGDSAAWKLTGIVDVGSPQKPSLVKFSSEVIYSGVLEHMIREHCPKYIVRKEGNGFTTILYMFAPTVLMIAFFWFIFNRQMRANGQGGVFDFGRSRARRLDDAENPVVFDDVAGCDEAKEDMQEIVDYLKSPEKFSRLGGKIPRGVLLVGPPGTGKTLLAKAIAGEANVPFFSISGSDFVEMFVGVGASRVRDMFNEGKKNAPCLIFIDEIDAVGRQRFSGIGGGHDEREQTLNALLVEMDGFEVNQGIIVIAATNRPDVLDKALLRPGRFDRQIVVDLPDLRGRLAILKIHAKKTKLDETVDLRIIARGTPGFSGADLANLINEAALLATRRNLEAVGMAELEEARDKVQWGKERRSRRMDDKVRELTAYHESGHALTGMLCKHATPLHKVTIIPRGASLGSTMSLPENDQVMVRKDELLDYIAVCLGGRVAEELIFKDVSTGASMDIRQATDIAKKMVCQYGMSESMGLINYAGREEHIFLGRDITRAEDFSPETAREIDLEIRRFVTTQYQRVHQLLESNLDKLKLLAQTLLEKETMDAHEIYTLLDMEEPASSRSADDLASDFDDPVAEALRRQDEKDENGESGEKRELEKAAREALKIVLAEDEAPKDDGKKAPPSDKA